ncbi:AraC family transcriptional regulator [Brevibacillus sp. RS1.1]|uniref:AraC family transcriptional regulator n=1 Tax=Brevibacillus sp. RS1.1 TaxID=2738982 RepID=UPI00156A781B|nr:AraC family transcriptional regulator [Brevibacillus sp. RS1.1]NRR04888.1 AraC family transcriptional regulator [Brevibacillus sp. RS1.1]
MNNEASGAKLSPPSFFAMTAIQKVNVERWQDYLEPEDYMMIIATDGEGFLEIESSTYRFTRERCWIAAPRQNVRISCTGHVLDYYSFTFRVVHTRAPMEEQASEAFFCMGELTCTPFSRVVELIAEIYKHREATEALQRFYNHVRFEELLCVLAQQNVPGRTRLDPRRAVERSIEYVEKHFQEPLTVDQLAQEANVPRWRYTQLFKEMTGEIPLDYMNQLRINRAKQLLLMTGDRINEIAQNVGFNSEYYFSRRFKQRVGLAPGKYRNIHRDDLRVVSLYMEDYLLALGIRPVVQWAHTYWGQQDYLGLHDVPTYDVLTDDVQLLSSQAPDVIMLRECTGWKADVYAQCARIALTCVIRQFGPEWRKTLHTLGDRLGRSELAERSIEQYEQKVRAAKNVMARSLKGQKVAFLRISADQILVEKNYTSQVLFQDLEMEPALLVKKQFAKQVREGVSWEELSTLDADHIFFAFDRWHQGETGAEQLQLNHPVWQSLPAVQSKRAYQVDFMTWMNHGVIANGKKVDDVRKVLA